MRQLNTTLSFLIMGILIFSVSDSYSYHQSDSYSENLSSDSTKTSLVDHHVHLFSPKDRRYLERNVKKIDTLPPLGIKQYLAVMKKSNVEKASVLSTAYFFSKQGKTSKQDLKAVQSDNNRIAEAVSNNPRKIVGFFSINPLSESALKVINRSAVKKEFAGVKLHLANSRVDLRNDAHVHRLAEVFRKANARDLVILIHMRTHGKSYGRKDAEIFVDQVLSEAPDIPVQIANVARWGGYDKQTDAALNVFASRISANELSNIYFDISGVIRPPSTSGNDSTAIQTPDWYPEQRYRRLATQLRKIGMDRILFGTDWPDWSPASYKADIEENIPLSDEELTTIFTNRAPWFKE